MQADLQGSEISWDHVLDQRFLVDANLPGAFLVDLIGLLDGYKRFKSRITECKHNLLTSICALKRVSLTHGFVSIVSHRNRIVCQVIACHTDHCANILINRLNNHLSIFINRRGWKCVGKWYFKATADCKRAIGFRKAESDQLVRRLIEEILLFLRRLKTEVKP